MQRKLIVMRHASPVSGFEAENDHARPLTDRGRSEGPMIARALDAAGWVPELVIHSDAQRTCETWTTMAPHFEPRPEANATRALYLAPAPGWMQIVSELPDNIGCVLMLGHNPGAEQVTTQWTGVHTRFGAASAAMLAVDAHSWDFAAHAKGCWDLVRMLFPEGG